MKTKKRRKKSKVGDKVRALTNHRDLIKGQVYTIDGVVAMCPGYPTGIFIKGSYSLFGRQLFEDIIDSNDE